MKKPIIISVVNAKGGVGKTTSTLNIGAALARSGYQTLLIDIDLQANLTHYLCGDLPEDSPTIAEALLYETGLESAIIETKTENLFLVPAGDSLVGVDLNLVGVMGRERILERTIQKTKGIGEFDFILIDNPPYMSLVTLNSLVASSHYVIPTSCDYLPSMGIRLLNENISQIQSRLNPDLKLLGVVLTMYDRREAITEQVESLIRETFGEVVFKSPIRINTRFKTSPAEHLTIFEWDQGGKGADDYMSVSKELIQRLIAQGNLESPRLRAVANE